MLIVQKCFVEVRMRVRDQIAFGYSNLIPRIEVVEIGSTPTNMANDAPDKGSLRFRFLI